MPKSPKIGKPLSQPAYSSRLMSHLQSQIQTVPRKGISYEPINFSDLIHPVAEWAWDDIAARKKLHKFARHVRSSQAFAVNLFGALPLEGVRAILTSFFGPIRSVDRPLFEFEDQEDRLRESVVSGQRTQIDVVLRGVKLDGREVALLIEVKLTEHDFGNCSGDCEENDTRHLCSTPGPFGNDSENCFKLRNAGGVERRTYDRYVPVTAVSSTPAFDGCWYRTSAYQPMRNVALAGMLNVEDGIETAVAVCAPLLHREMWSHFQRARSVLPEDSLHPLPAEIVLSLHDQVTFEFLRDLYFLDVGCDTELSDDRELATWHIIETVDSLFDHQLVIAETHAGGGLYDCISLVERDHDGLRSVVDLNREGRIHILSFGSESVIEDGWATVLSGNVEAVAREIGTALGLSARNSQSAPVAGAYRRAIDLGRRAGESLKWRIDESADLGPHTDFFSFLGHRLERCGSKYDETDLPRAVFASRF